MERIKCVVAYDGTNFAGYQVQPNERTVQGEIEKVLKRIHKEDIIIHSSGRTDAAVHAKGQVFHFDTPLFIPVEKWQLALNTQLPDDIYIESLEKVSTDFHARYSAEKKEYRYKISLKKERNVFWRNYLYHYPYKIDINKMEEAARYFIGTHDFTLFCSAKSNKEIKVRTIYDIQINQQEQELEIAFIGNGFLYNMVRILVGVLLEVGQGRIAPQEIEKVLKKQHKRLRAKTAPGHGLYLWEVTYP